jgi:hypothetical protein
MNDPLSISWQDHLCYGMLISCSGSNLLLWYTVTRMQYWHLVGKDVTKEVLNFLNGNAMPIRWNETVVVLIPKVENPRSQTN